MIEILQQEWFLTILKIFILVFAFVMPLSTVLTLMERKWSALIQDRIGPNRANIGSYRGKGLLHIAADGLKSIFKEDFIPENAQKVLFTLAPFFGFLAAFVTFAIIPVAAPYYNFTFQITDVSIGILLVFAFTSLGVYGAVLGGWSSGNKYSLLGSIRASAQMISYEVFLGFSLIGVFMVYGTLQVSQLIEGQSQYWLNGWIPKWGIFTQPLAFLLFFTAMIAELKRAPFDAPEGESEIIAGYFLEYSGMRFASFMLAEYVALVGVACLVTTLFFGGYHIPWLYSELVQGEMIAYFKFGNFEPFYIYSWLAPILQFFSFAIKVVFFCWLQIVIRWSLPRFRFDQTMNLGWKKLLPLCMLNTIVTAIVLLL